MSKNLANTARKTDSIIVMAEGNPGAEAELFKTITQSSGFEVGEIKRNFNSWSTLGIMYTLTATPTIIGYSLSVVIGVGGGPFFIFGYLLTLLLQGVVCACLSELASAFPHASGQVHWTTSLVPGRSGIRLAYFAGSFALAAWFFWNVGTGIFVSRILFSAVLMVRPDFDLQPYQIYLVYISVLGVSHYLNTYGFHAYTWIMRKMVVALNLLTLTILISLLVRAAPKQSARTVFVEVVNETGWSSTGLVFFLSLLPGITAMNGFDGAAHLANEMDDPGRRVPQVMLGNLVLGGVVAFPMAIVYMFCVTNWENLLTPFAGSSFTQLIYDSVDLLPLSMAITIALAISSIIGVACVTTTFSRTLQSFAEQRYFIGSPWLARLDKRNGAPGNAVLLSTVLSTLVGLLMLGNSTVLNAILGSAAICFFCSYAIPISCLLYQGRSRLPTNRYFGLGKFGLVLNWVALLWMALMSVMLCFPQYVPVTATLMNYTAPVCIGIALLAAANWVLFARKHILSSEHATQVTDLAGSRVSQS
ncbi:hypothetical protein LTR56_017592 [Elasticomyces elasticus]|nr:hypothetical protein LTR56_017592 [Elasticomyces elasticus]KAK3630775.1 hypothetical protein LTR22_021354 [Elasticomyces elasticus]KAK5749280.1 hypothetical protein LTS12_020660 [Elasticomyces elasticus]